jgi:hypothetical protein
MVGLALGVPVAAFVSILRDVKAGQACRHGRKSSSQIRGGADAIALGTRSRLDRFEG